MANVSKPTPSARKPPNSIAKILATHPAFKPAGPPTPSQQASFSGVGRGVEVAILKELETIEPEEFDGDKFVSEKCTGFAEKVGGSFSYWSFIDYP